jgi:hypothetical protein
MILIGFERLKKTLYFTEQVLRKRPYLKGEWIEKIISNPVFREVQDNNRVRYWG